MVRKIIGGVITTAVCVMFTSMPVVSQELLQQQAAPIEINDEELEMAANAYVVITEINQEFQQSLQQVEDPEQRQQLQIEANDKFVEAIEKEGLEVDQYNTIMQQVSTTEDLHMKFGMLIQQLQ